MYNGDSSKHRVETILNKHNVTTEVRNLVSVLQAKINQLENDKVIEGKIIKQLKEKIDYLYSHPKEVLLQGMIPEDFY